MVKKPLNEQVAEMLLEAVNYLRTDSELVGYITMVSYNGRRRVIFSCDAVESACIDKGKWSDVKIERVMFRYLRRLGVDTFSTKEFNYIKNQQDARALWLTFAAQTALECPELVPKY